MEYKKKNLSNNWQPFSYLFDTRIAKISKKLKYHDGFLRADQNRAKMLPD
jgi:hypothetical protein